MKQKASVNNKRDEAEMGTKDSSLTVNTLKHKESRAANENAKCFYMEVLSEIYFQ